MKKFLVCLMCCFGIFTLCSATSTVGDVYLNEFDILVNGEEYSPTLPVLNYQGRTYLPLNEFGSMTGNDISFANNTISVTQNNSSLKYKELFLVSSLLYNMDKSLTTSRIYFGDCYENYCLSYVNKEVKKGFKNSKGFLDMAVNSVVSYYEYRDLIIDICVENNLATSKELNKLFDDIKYYPLFLQEAAKVMDLEVSNNLSFRDYSESLSLCNTGHDDITNSLNKIQANISNKILNLN